MTAADSTITPATTAGDPEPVLRTDQAVIDVAVASATPTLLDPGAYAAMVVPAGGSVVVVNRDTDEHRRQAGQLPSRSVAGTTIVRDETSLVELVKRWPDWKDTAVVYADPVDRKVVAVLDDDWNANGSDSGGEMYAWRQRRVQLALTHTPEWLRWAAHNRKMLPQQAFAEHIEDCLEDIRTPTAADMLEVAQTLTATVGVQFRSQNRLRDGNRQFTYAESTDAAAGTNGTLAVPEEFELALVPWQGRTPTPFVVRARLRYRITSQGLSIGYVLADVDRILQTAFTEDVVGPLVDAGLFVVNGQP